MKNVWVSAIAGVLALGVGGGEVISEVKTLKDVANPRNVQSPAEGVFQADKNVWLVGKKPLNASPDRCYRVSCEAKSVTEKPVKGVRIGFAPRDAKRRSAVVSGVMPVRGTETAVIAPVKKSDAVIRVADASKWRKGPTRIVYDADPDGQMRDIPNFDFVAGRPKTWKPDRNGWVVELDRPAGVELASGTVIRQHVASRNAIFSNPKTVSGPDWQTVEFIVGPGETRDGRENNKLFPGIVTISPLVTLPAEVQIRNLKVEVMK